MTGVEGNVFWQEKACEEMYEQKQGKKMQLEVNARIEAKIENRRK